MNSHKKIDFEKEIEKMLPVREDAIINVDYSIVEQRKPEWETISRVAQSPVFVFDCFTRKFVYASRIGLEHFGLTPESFLEQGHTPVLNLVHPDDIRLLLLTRNKVYGYLQSIPPEKIKTYKLVHELRIRNLAGQYIRITEQEQVIELDDNGQIWLMMSVFNVDAGNEKEPVKSHVYNFETGEQHFIELSEMLEESLTPREIEILKLIREGLISKEISDRLGISTNTVNVHRQNIFTKLNVDNAFEAVNVALELGLLN